MISENKLVTTSTLTLDCQQTLILFPHSISTQMITKVLELALLSEASERSKKAK